MEWSYVWVTLIMLLVATTYILAIVFFRRMYYGIEEIEARLIQIRDLIESQNPKDKKRPTVARPAAPPGRPSSHDTAYGR
jgi:hypothetical protein